MEGIVYKRGFCAMKYGRTPARPPPPPPRRRRAAAARSPPRRCPIAGEEGTRILHETRKSQSFFFSKQSLIQFIKTAKRVICKNYQINGVRHNPQHNNNNPHHRRHHSVRRRSGARLLLMLVVVRLNSEHPPVVETS